MRVNFAHVRHPSAAGGYIDFAVFDARSTNGTEAGNAEVLRNLTLRARANGLKIDQSALTFSEGGRVRFYGDGHLVEHLSRSGVPHWTHCLDTD